MVRVVELTALMVRQAHHKFWLPYSLISLFFLSGFFVLISASPLLGQGEQTPQATTGQEFFKAPQKFARVDKNKNKILDDLDKLIRPAIPEDRFDVIVMLNKPLDLLPTLKGRHGSFTEKFTYPSINGFATNLTKGQIVAFAKDADVKLVEYDAPVYPHLDTAQHWFGTAKARADLGLDGNTDGSASYSKDDVVIAILDTGIDDAHVDLDGGKVIGWQDFTPNNRDSPYDEVGDCVGHGSHVSSIAAGEGDGNSAYKGVAPGAALVGLKVLQEQPGECSGSVSWIDAAIEWVILKKDDYGIEVANLSLGVAGCSDGSDSTSLLINQAVGAGVVVAVSAGNEGPGSCTIGSPAAAAEAITVGAMADVTPMASSLSFSCGKAPNKGFYLVCFSSRGLTDDGRIKPDIASPGIFINAAAAGTGNDYKELSGTSMASPFTAGVAALILDAQPNYTPAQVKSTIESNGLDWGPAGKDVDYGSGRLQGYRAIKAAGGFSGIGPAVPSHSFESGSLSRRKDEDFWNIEVTDATLPIAITMVMSDWEAFNKPDFDMELRDPNDTLLDNSISVTRQETIGVQPTIIGTYQLRVYSYAGRGNYFFDVSFGQAAVAISLDTDGETPFGTIALGQTIDTTSNGTDDVQIIRVDAGPADLSVKSNEFSDGFNVWSLAESSGSDQVKWEFSKDGTAWNLFSTANTLFTFDTGVDQSNTSNLYLRLTMPTATSSNDLHESTVTITATQP